MEIKPEYEKGLFGSVKGIKGVTVSDIENLKATAIKGLEARDRLEKLTFEHERVKETCADDGRENERRTGQNTP